ncbi:peptidase M15 family protein [Campylobacter jejuni subsp. doylei]|uniref:Peptidase M15 family protein n=1 Tax=Campylobacter jejuni subsp. doylei TaxID=32021 RepID=A0A3S4STC8_CAMJU|nr:peptidase M15 family protein [Campylobacter jejuni subsp. doylei]
MVKGVKTEEVHRYVLQRYSEKGLGIAIKHNFNDAYAGFVHLDTRGKKQDGLMLKENIMLSFILSRFLSPSKIAFFVLIALCGFLYLKNNALTLENENLKLKALHFNNEINGFKDKLAQQNKAIDKLKLDLKPKETLKEVLKVDKVLLKIKVARVSLKLIKNYLIF